MITRKGFTEVFTWGNDESGQMGLSGKKGSKTYNTPKYCSFNVIIHQISCGRSHSAFIASNGYIYTMGSNEEGKLGISQKSVQNSFTPCLVETLSRYKAVKVVCGGAHTATVVETGELFTWGSGSKGQLGLGNTVSQYTPQIVSFGHIDATPFIIRDIEAGEFHTVVRSENEDVFAFGEGEDGQLGTGKRDNEIRPSRVNCLTAPISQFACGLNFTLYLTSSQKVLATGNNEYGQLGIGNRKGSAVPIKIIMLDSQRIMRIAAGGEQAAAISENHDLYFWGKGEALEKEDFLFPKKIMTSKSLVEYVWLGENFGMALDVRGNIQAWGDNQNGQLGLGDNSKRDEPQLIAALQNKKVLSMACGSNFCIALGGINNGSSGNVSLNQSSAKKSVERVSEEHDLDSSIRGKSKSPFRSGMISHISPGGGGGLIASNTNRVGLKRNLGSETINPLDEFNSRGRTKTPMKQLTPEEIRMRQREASYDSPNRMNDNTFKFGTPNEDQDNHRLINDSQIQSMSPSVYETIQTSQRGPEGIKSQNDEKSSSYRSTDLKKYVNSINTVTETKDRQGALSVERAQRPERPFIERTPGAEKTNQLPSSQPSSRNIRRANRSDVENLEDDRVPQKSQIIATQRNSPSAVGGGQTSFYLEKLEVERKEKEELLNTVYDLKKMITKLERNSKEANINNEEINSLKDKNSKLEKRVKSLEQELQKEQLKNNDLEEQMENQQGKFNEIKWKNDDRENILESLNELTDMLNSEREKTEKLSVNLEKIREFYEVKIEAIYEEESKNRLDLERAIEERGREISKLSERIKSLDRENVEHNSILSSLKRENDDLKAGYFTAKQDVDKVKTLNQELSKENRELKQVLKDKEKFEELKAEYEREIEELNQMLNEKDSEIDALIAERKRALGKGSEAKPQAHQEQLFNEINDLKSKLALLEGSMEMKENENEQLRNIVDELNRKNRILTLDPDHSKFEGQSSARGLGDSGGEISNMLRSYNEDGSAPGHSRSKSIKSVNFDLKNNSVRPLNKFINDNTKEEQSPYEEFRENIEKEDQRNFPYSNNGPDRRARDKSKSEYSVKDYTISVEVKKGRDSNGNIDEEQRIRGFSASSSGRKLGEEKPAEKQKVSGENREILNRIMDSAKNIKDKYQKESPIVSNPQADQRIQDESSFRQNRWRENEESEVESLLDESIRNSRDIHLQKSNGKNPGKNILDASRNSIGNINNSVLNTSSNSMMYSSNLKEIKEKLSELQKNKNVLEQRMQDFEKRLKESK